MNWSALQVEAPDKASLVMRLTKRAVIGRIAAWVCVFSFLFLTGGLFMYDALVGEQRSLVDLGVGLFIFLLGAFFFWVNVRDSLRQLGRPIRLDLLDETIYRGAEPITDFNEVASLIIVEHEKGAYRRLPKYSLHLLLANQQERVTLINQHREHRELLTAAAFMSAHDGWPVCILDRAHFNQLRHVKTSYNHHQPIKSKSDVGS